MYIQKDRKTVLQRIVFTLIIIAFIIGSAGFFISRLIKKEIQAEKYNEVAAIANMKIREITRWIDERKFEGLFLQQNPDFINMVDELIANPDDRALKEKIRQWVNPIISNHDYCGMHIYDTSHSLLVSYIVIGKDVETGLLNNDNLYAGNNFGSQMLGDLYYSNKTRHYHLDLYTPIFFKTKQLGTVVLTINPEMVLFPSIVDLPVHSETSETLIVRKDNDSVVFLNRLRFAENEPLQLKFKIDSFPTLPAAKAVTGHQGFYTGNDYRNKRVLAKITDIPGTNWFIVSKIDLKEVYAPFWQRSIMLAIFALLLLVAIGAVLTSLWKRSEAHLLRRQLEAEKETKALKQHYSYLTRYANDIIILMNEKGEIVQVNERGLEKYGYTIEEVKGVSVRILRAKSTHIALPDNIKQVLEKGHTILESIHITKEGVEFPVEISARSIKIEDKTFIQSIVRDISNRKKYEQAILERENNLNITLESIGDAVIATNNEGKITRLNKVAEELTGWKSSDAVTQPIHQVMVIRNAKDGKPIDNVFNRVMQENQVIGLSDHVELVSKTGKVLQIADSAAPIHDHNGNLVGSVIVFRDVSEKYRQEQILRESEEKFRLLAESSPIAIMIYQGEKWVYCNKGAQIITGYDPEDILKWNFWDFVHPDDKESIKERGKARQEGKDVPSRYQFRIIAKGGDVRWVDLSGIMISYNGKPAGMVSVLDITEQKEAMLRIAESESRLGSIFKAAPVGIGLTVNRNIIEVNDRICQMTGYSHNELIGQSAQILYASEKEYDFVGKHKYAQIERTGIGEIETQWMNKKGTLIDVQMRSVPLDASDISKGYMFTALDITERKRSEESVRESQRTLSTLMSNLQGIVYRCRNTKQWSMLFLSDGFKQITGFDPDNFLADGNRAFADLIHPDDREASWKMVQNSISDQSSFEYEYRIMTISGEYKWVWEKGRGIFNDDGELLFLEGFISDLSWRKRNEEVQKVVFNIANAVNVTTTLVELSSLIRNELSRIIDTQNFFIALYNKELNTISLPFMADQKDEFQIFPAGKTLTGFVIENSKPILVQEEEIREMASKGLIELHGTVSKTWLGVPLKYKDDVIGALVIQDYEKPNAYSMIDLEIMKFVSNQVALSIEKKRAEDELRTAKEKAVESDKLKTAFLANMSHEIRTPMNAIIGFSDLLADSGLPEGDKKNFIHIIQNNGNVLLNLIDDIIDMAKLEAGQLSINKRVLNVNTVLDDLYNYFIELRNKMEKPHVEIRFPQYRCKNFELMTDALRFRQIISNLLNNALKFTESGFIELGYKFELPASAPEGTPESAVTFYVKDTGVGIPEDKLLMVFDRFRQVYDSHSRIFGGTGLGLTISRNLTEMLGGKIWVESKPGHGTTFYVALPSEDKKFIADPEQYAYGDQTESFNGSGLHVLIAEDEASSAYFLETMVAKTGARVSAVSNGFDAVEKCKNDKSIDLVFMDIRMPLLDGYEAAKQIKTIRPDLPIIAQTAFAMPEEVQRSLQNGCNGHITKPLRPSEIFSVLKKHSLDKSAV
jgi:PAS domain S-box-containing protein